MLRVPPGDRMEAAHGQCAGGAASHGGVAAEQLPSRDMQVWHQEYDQHEQMIYCT